MFPARNRSLQANPIPTIDLHGLLTAEAVTVTAQPETAGSVFVVLVVVLLDALLIGLVFLLVA